MNVWGQEEAGSSGREAKAEYGVDFGADGYSAGKLDVGGVCLEWGGLYGESVSGMVLAFVDWRFWMLGNLQSSY